MKQVTKIIFLLLFAITSNAQVQKYSRAKIWLLNKNVTELASAGIDITEGDFRPGVWFISEFSDVEINKVRAKGFTVEILIDDLKAHHQHHDHPADPHPTPNSMNGCNTSGAPDYPQPQNFSLGSMAGFFTYQEMLDNLDSMASKYPNLITIKQPIGTQTTNDGNQLLWVKISDNPNVNETEPEVLYSALHHAREPAGLTNLIYYMWYLLENYATNTELQLLVDNTEMYFVPCINPDGYLYNEFTDPSGGGMWRKNRLDNLDGTYGVDLNRNYGFQWGFDDNGSSPFTSDATYRGIAPFSEIETQIMQSFCTAHNFRLALNYHTYGNLLIYPWGYVPNFYTPDSALYVNYGSLLTTYNKYVYGTANQTVNYIVNGSSDDWMYGEQLTKGKIFAMTPEASLSGFWPPSSEIIDIAKNNMYANITMAKLAGKYGLLKELNPGRVSTTSFYSSYNLKAIGLDTSGTFTVSVVPVSSNIISTGVPNLHSNLSILQEANDSINITLSPSVSVGDSITYVLTVTNGTFAWSDTVKKRFGNGLIIFSDNASNLNNWTSIAWWNVTTEDFVSTPSAITDSPLSTYPPSSILVIRTTNNINIGSASHVWLSFFARWQIENNYDFVQIAISTDSGATWTPLCGKYTNPGSQFQGNAPVYDGFQSDWVQEEINLDAYIGQSVKFMFYLESDAFMEYDGFYFDDFKIEKIPLPTSVSNIDVTHNFISDPMPNPSQGYSIVSYSIGKNNGTFKLINMLGEVVFTQSLLSTHGNVQLNTDKLGSGVYSYFIELKNERQTEIKKLLITN